MIGIFITSLCYYINRARVLTDKEFVILVLVLVVILWQYVLGSSREHFKEEEKKCIVIDVDSFKTLFTDVRTKVVNHKFTQQARDSVAKYIRVLNETLKGISGPKPQPKDVTQSQAVETSETAINTTSNGNINSVVSKPLATVNAKK